MDRRTLIAGLALTPALAIPAVAQTMLCAPVDLDAAIAEYWRLWELQENHPYAHARKSDPRYEELLKDSRRACEATAAAFMKVIDMPSRCGADIGKKIDIVINEYQDFELPNDILERISADAKRLAANQGITHEHHQYHSGGFGPHP